MEKSAVENEAVKATIDRKIVSKQARNEIKFQSKSLSVYFVSFLKHFKNKQQ